MNRDGNTSSQDDVPHRAPAARPLRSSFFLAGRNRWLTWGGIAAALAVAGLLRLSYLDHVSSNIGVPTTENTEFSSPESQPQESTETQEGGGLIPGLILLALALGGGWAAARHLEKNGYTVKRFEDKVNKKIRRRRDDPEP